MDFTWKIGGAQGEGIDSAGEIFALTLHRKGYYIYAYRHFMSLIKGGHTNYKVRISSKQHRHRGDQLDLLVAFDQRSIDENLHELKSGGAVLYNAGAFEPKFPADVDVVPIGVPMQQIAKDHGSIVMTNMAAMGASAALVGLEPDAFDDFIAERYGKHGADVVEANRKVVRAGFQAASEATSWRARLPELPPEARGKKRLFMHGNDAIALGAVVAGCRVVAAYPITPATDILYSLLKLLPEYGGVVLQAEDEMAACQMAVGCNYAGVRAMTSTSGPGFSLMTETLGLASVSETPVVIVDVQRAGPSTGMPTKTEQGDAFQAIFSSHGESQRIVLAPATVEDCFYDIQRAFNLADKYQCPVIVLTDLSLGLSKQTVEVDDIDFEKIAIDRGQLLTEEQVKEIAANGGYKRYALTESGISPRALPGQEGGVHLAISYEHTEEGWEDETPLHRVAQTEKRIRKMSTFDPAEFGVRQSGDASPDLLLVGWGSTIGQIDEAREALKAEGISVGHLHLSVLYPFPAKEVREAIESARAVLIVENNAFGQLQQLIQLNVGHYDHIHHCRKFSGEPFKVFEIVARAKEVLAAKSVKEVG
ncbi:MAG: 2-oxoacid:acceptor oxidoreductase subunit alpha [Firmicutes bacterium]|nr:2-oxoacid:acceptor oxidoreductase subunit alpha [Bacillota bacterium]MBO2521975.1 2-oxoacid:acceptor oxidoreductase subunit alpha [Bacillota bacterium]